MKNELNFGRKKGLDKQSLKSIYRYSKRVFQSGQKSIYKYRARTPQCCFLFFAFELHVKRERDQSSRMKSVFVDLLVLIVTSLLVVLPNFKFKLVVAVGVFVYYAFRFIIVLSEYDMRTPASSKPKNH